MSKKGNYWQFFKDYYQGDDYKVISIYLVKTHLRGEIGIVTVSVRFFRNIGTIVFVTISGYIMNLTLMSSSTINFNYTQAPVLSIQNIFLKAIVLPFIGLYVALFLKELPLGVNARNNS